MKVTERRDEAKQRVPILSRDFVLQRAGDLVHERHKVGCIRFFTVNDLESRASSLFAHFRARNIAERRGGFGRLALRPVIARGPRKFIWQLPGCALRDEGKKNAIIKREGSWAAPCRAKDPAEGFGGFAWVLGVFSDPSSSERGARLCPAKNTKKLAELPFGVSSKN